MLGRGAVTSHFPIVDGRWGDVCALGQQFTHRGSLDFRELGEVRS